MRLPAIARKGDTLLLDKGLTITAKEQAHASTEAASEEVDLHGRYKVEAVEYYYCPSEKLAPIMVTLRLGLLPEKRGDVPEMVRRSLKIGLKARGIPMPQSVEEWKKLFSEYPPDKI